MHSKIPITALTVSVLSRVPSTEFGYYKGQLFLYKDSFELQILNMQILKQREFRITISILS